MARPRKDDLSRRKRWEIYVTPLERLRIEEGARGMGLPIGAAAAKAFGGVQHVERAVADLLETGEFASAFEEAEPDSWSTADQWRGE